VPNPTVSDLISEMKAKSRKDTGDAPPDALEEYKKAWEKTEEKRNSILGECEDYDDEVTRLLDIACHDPRMDKVKEIALGAIKGSRTNKFNRYGNDNFDRGVCLLLMRLKTSDLPDIDWKVIKDEELKKMYKEHFGLDVDINCSA
jgi:hypothetical protein